MRNLLKIAVLLLFVFGCGSDDEPTPEVFSKMIVLQSICYDTDSETAHCVTDAEMELQLEWLSHQSPCTEMTVKDIFGVFHKGYYRSGRRAWSEADCIIN